MTEKRDYIPLKIQIGITFNFVKMTMRPEWKYCITNGVLNALKKLGYGAGYFDGYLDAFIGAEMREISNKIAENEHQNFTSGKVVIIDNANIKNPNEYFKPFVFVEYGIFNDSDKMGMAVYGADNTEKYDELIKLKITPELFNKFNHGFLNIIERYLKLNELEGIRE